jgi:uncharacterized protein YqeY
MTFNELQALKVTAMKSGDKERIKVLNDIIVLVQKEQTKGKTKVEATEEMVAACALKVQKTLEEMVATCPDEGKYAESLASYMMQLAIATEYAPKMISDPDEIARMVVDTIDGSVELTVRNKGKIMKLVMPALKGKVDMAVANKVIGGMLE